ncbi:MAG TPA: hypothetical protein VE959_23145 [Bryobacteraceae bacterium]|nr:hypothetical protein [Bryobacteraceae bacterium]
MILNTSMCLGVGGVFADLFLSGDRKLIFKVFVGPGHPSKGYAHAEEQRRRNTFGAECKAYVIASRDSALSPHVPQSFERPEIEDVLDNRGGSVRGEYLVDCCYCMEFIDGGQPEKIGSCRSAYPHIERAEIAFKTANIRYMADCCVFFPHDEQNFKFIDFAVEDFPLPDYNPPWL